MTHHGGPDGGAHFISRVLMSRVPCRCPCSIPITFWFPPTRAQGGIEVNKMQQETTPLLEIGEPLLGVRSLVLVSHCCGDKSPRSSH